MAERRFIVKTSEELDKALLEAEEGDEIQIGAGTYSLPDFTERVKRAREGLWWYSDLKRVKVDDGNTKS